MRTVRVVSLCQPVHDQRITRIESNFSRPSEQDDPEPVNQLKCAPEGASPLSHHAPTRTRSPSTNPPGMTSTVVVHVPILPLHCLMSVNKCEVSLYPIRRPKSGNKISPSSAHRQCPKPRLWLLFFPVPTKFLPIAFTKCRRRRPTLPPPFSRHAVLLTPPNQIQQVPRDVRVYDTK